MSATNVSDDLLKQLGRISVNFQFMETHIAFLTWIFIKSDQRTGQIVTANLSFSRLCDVCMSLFRHRYADQALLEKLDAIIKRASESENQRNLLMHSMWLTQADPADHMRMKYTISRKAGLKVHAEKMTIENIRAVADEMQAVIDALNRFMLELFAGPQIEAPVQVTE
jgi:hypothetical protein